MSVDDELRADDRLHRRVLASAARFDRELGDAAKIRGISNP